MDKKKLMIFALFLVVLVGAGLLLTQPAFADKLAEAIAQTPTGTEPGMINPEENDNKS